jgi:uncharacterized FAD-dependent dehydrogenase
VSEEREVTLELDEIDDEGALRRKLGLADEERVYVVRRSVDARRGRVRFQVRVQVGGDDPLAGLGGAPLQDVARPARVAIIGAGPAGLFCAYELARAGVASVILDRGKKVQPRRKDLAQLNRGGEVDEDSNYCFGEGGAGTYSDGKLYTRAKKRGDVRDIYEVLALHGAPPDILVDARPHIGSNLLPKVVTAIRERLESVGVEVRFGARALGLRVKDGAVTGVELAEDGVLEVDHVVVATGHSARDVWRFLSDAGVALAPKAFAMGVRIEHPQALINQQQYGRAAGHPSLPAAPYRVAHTADDRGVFSFCMCPGGFIVPASTERAGLVVNGMSLKRRDSPFANSGLVVSVDLEDLPADPFAALELQDRLERAALEAGGGQLRAPATRASDFVAGRASSTVPETSYRPGLTATDLRPVLDSVGLGLSDRLAEALAIFERKMPGYASDEAVLVGVESRTSAPIRVPRDDETLEAPDVRGVYPCGEGAGFAGGIVSAALDGVRVARAILRAR